jgi:ubiquinone/menaquinone biosynthesis C-methylase UbiE
MSVVDFGAGTGWISRSLSNLGVKVCSLDVSETALTIGKKIRDSDSVLFPRPPITYSHFDGRRFPLENQSMDRILCNDALHHVPNVDEVLGEMARVLRPGGIAGFCEPGPRHSLEPRSQQEMREFNVLENDVDLTAIHGIAMKAGFKRMAVSIFSPYHLDISFEEWTTLTPHSAAMKRYADRAYTRMKLNTLFFLYMDR